MILARRAERVAMHNGVIDISNLTQVLQAEFKNPLWEGLMVNLRGSGGEGGKGRGAVVFAMRNIIFMSS